MAIRARRLIGNAPGRFYVDDQCIYCDLCVTLAPTIFREVKSQGWAVVFHQPTTKDEFELGRQAAESCPTDSIGMDGDKSDLVRSRSLVASTKDIAEFFRLGLLGGFIKQSDAIRWADSLISTSEKPEDAALDLSISEPRGRLAAIEALGAFQGDSDPVLPTNLLLAWCNREAVTRKRDEFALLAALLRLPIEENVRYRVDALDDAKYLADEGVYGPVETVRLDARAFLGEFLPYEYLLPTESTQNVS